jgi:hypothetical protein
MESTPSNDHRLTPRSRLGPAGTLPFGNPQSSSTGHQCPVALGCQTMGQARDQGYRVVLLPLPD